MTALVADGHVPAHYTIEVSYFYVHDDLATQDVIHIFANDPATKKPGLHADIIIEIAEDGGVLGERCWQPEESPSIDEQSLAGELDRMLSARPGL